MVSAWMQGTLFPVEQCILTRLSMLFTSAVSGVNVVVDWRMFPLNPGNLTLFPGVQRTEREPHHML